MNDLDVVKKYILQNGHVGLRRTYNHLKKDLGLNVTQKKIQDIKIEIKNSFENLSFNSLNKKVVFPYLGGWFFDIIDNRGKVGHEHEAGYTKGWAVFLHGNSGYVVAFPLNNKSGANLTKVYNEFKTYCKKLPVVVYKNGKGRAQNTPVVEYVEYPINNIVSDKEKGWGKNFDTNILKMNAGENHRFLSKINAFAGHLRKRYFGQGNTGNKQRYITKDEFDDFVTEWNLSYLNFNGCTRGQMLVDPNLELAYAITCHKSQGSQFTNTIVVIPKCSSFFMSKEMLYTIFTRHEENIYVLVEVDDKNITDDELKKELLKFSHYKYSKTIFILTNLFNDNPKLIHREDFGWFDENKVHITERGEKVRSKSEVIIANHLYQKEKDLKIEYSYETKYEGKNGDCKLPDFTITKGDKIYLLEHLGMLSDENYKNKWEEKKKWYEDNGIYEASDDNKDEVQLIITKDENGALEEDIYNKLDKYFD